MFELQVLPSIIPKLKLQVCFLMIFFPNSLKIFTCCFLFFILFIFLLLKLPFISICKVLKNILQMLGGGDMSGSHIEFGTVLIWTCRQSCWASGDYVREERVVVQAERF